jgi:hypothetical protein
MTKLGYKDWHAVAGVIAAVAALALHLLHIVDDSTVLLIILVILALMMIRDLHHEDRYEGVVSKVDEIDETIDSIRADTGPRDLQLIVPRQLTAVSQRFLERVQGDMIWFNAPLDMFASQGLFDRFLRPAIGNDRVGSIRFILDQGERERWEEQVVPMIQACRDHARVLDPLWVTIQESYYFILGHIEDRDNPDALLSLWQPPFMADMPGGDVPRYLIHVRSHADLIQRLVEIERSYHMGGEEGRTEASSPE